MTIETPAGYTALRGRGTYYAKERLKQLGAYWNPEAKAWFVPTDNLALAQAQVRLGAAANALLAPDPDLGSLPRAKPGVVCWICGETFTYGGNADEYDCGCVERAQTRRARLASHFR